jgi:hypothetical protein
MWRKPSWTDRANYVNFQVAEINLGLLHDTFFVLQLRLGIGASHGTVVSSMMEVIDS